MDKYAVLFEYFRQCPYLKNLMSIASESNKGNTVILPQGASPAVQGYGRGNGDLIVNISVYVPKTLSRDEKKALEAMKDSDNFKGDSATKQSIFQKFRNYFN